jgi:DNA uptake protein ComE-like DNA-binding protein
MKLNIEPIRSWFGFTRRERRSSFILLLLMVLLIALRYTVPERSIEIEDITASFSVDGNFAESPGKDLSFRGELFPFDPNTASFDTLIILGLDTKEANTLINYRKKGGIFRNPEDINKIYGIEERKAEELIPFIALNTDTILKVRISSVPLQKRIIDINHCDSEMLLTLPGIGPVLSVRIIKFRNLLGGYANIEQLKEVYGLSEETFHIIKESIIVDTTVVKKIYVNIADYKELTRLPYLNNYEAAAILKYRELKGRINGMADLINNKLVNEESAVKSEPYLRFD